MAKKLLVVKERLVKTPSAMADAKAKYDLVVTTNYNTYALFTAINNAKEIGATVINFAVVTPVIWDNMDVYVPIKDEKFTHYACNHIIDVNDYYGYLSIMARAHKAGIKVCINKEPMSIDKAPDKVLVCSYQQVLEVKNFLHSYAKQHDKIKEIDYYETKSGETEAYYDTRYQHMHLADQNLQTRYYFKNDKFVKYSDVKSIEKTELKGYQYQWDNEAGKYTPNKQVKISIKLVDMGTEEYQLDDGSKVIDNFAITSLGNRINFKTVIQSPNVKGKMVVKNYTYMDKYVSNYKHRNYQFIDTKQDMWMISEPPAVVKEVLDLMSNIFNYTFEGDAKQQMKEIVPYYLNQYYLTDSVNDINLNQLINIVKLQKKLDSIKCWEHSKTNFRDTYFRIEVRCYEVANFMKRIECPDEEYLEEDNKISFIQKFYYEEYSGCSDRLEHQGLLLFIEEAIEDALNEIVEFGENTTDTAIDADFFIMYYDEIKEIIGVFIEGAYIIVKLK